MNPKLIGLPENPWEFLKMIYETSGNVAEILLETIYKIDSVTAHKWTTSFYESRRVYLDERYDYDYIDKLELKPPTKPKETKQNYLSENDYIECPHCHEKGLNTIGSYFTVDNLVFRSDIKCHRCNNYFAIEKDYPTLGSYIISK